MLVGINLLREGLDIPECGLVAILDADKEGFLRSETSLIQTIGRAARNVDGPGDPLRRHASPARWSARSPRPTAGARSSSPITPSTASRRKAIKRNIHDIMAHLATRDGVVVDTGDEERPHLVGHNLKAYIADLEERMRKAAADLEFEEAARLRDEIRRLEEDDLGIPARPARRAAPARQFDRGQARHPQGPLRQAAADAVRRAARLAPR